MSCVICDGSGLVPFKNKEGKVIPHCWTYCECHQDEPVQWRDIQPSDYDFPMSPDFRALTFHYCGVLDPGYVLPEKAESKPPEQVIIHRHSDMGEEEYRLLQQTARRLGNLEKELAEKEKPRQRPQPKATPRVYEVDK